MMGRALTGLIPMLFASLVSPTMTFGEPLEDTTIMAAVGQIGGPIQGVAVQDSIVYVTVGPRLMVMQVSQSGSLTEIGGTRAFPRFLRDVVVSGGHAYVAAGEAGIFVIDVSDPADPDVVGSWDTPGFAEAVTVDGTTLFVADGPYGLRIVDVANATNPVEVAWAFSLHFALDVAVSENLVVIASMTAGLLIADVSDPADPGERGSLQSNGCAFGVDVDGQTAYVANGWGGLMSVDISQPWTPEETATLQTPGWAMDVAVDDGVAFVGDGYKGLRIVDVSEPGAPEEMSAFEFKGNAEHVVVSDGRAYLVNRPTELRVIDVVDTSDPVELGVTSTIGPAEGVAVSGHHVFLASGANGLQVVDVLDPATPQQIAQVETLGNANVISVVGDLAYVVTTDGPAGLDIFDISDPAQPVRVGFYQHWGFMDVEIAGDLAYMPDERGLLVLNISDPAAPFNAGWIDLGVNRRCGTTGVGVQGTLAGVAQAGEGTVYLDVSDPADMTVLGRLEGGWAWEVTLRENFAFVADVGLLVLDISDPGNPQQAGFAASGEKGREVVLDGAVAYMTIGKAGIVGFDVSDPYYPVKIAEYDSLGFAERAVVQDDLLYVADWQGGLIILEKHSSKRPGVPSTRLSNRGDHQSQPQGRDVGVQTLAPQGRSERGWIERRSSRKRRHPIVRGREFGQLAAQSSRTRRSDRARSGHGQPGPGATTESRALATTLQVTTTADSGSGSLRSCLEQAQSGDTIVFDPAVFPPHDPATILLSSELPPITQGRLTIDASESGVIVDGQNLPCFRRGIKIESDENTVRGLQIYDFCGNGVDISGDGNVIGGNRSIGAGPVGRGNVLSGSRRGSSGLTIWAGSDNIVTGNLIGTDVTGKHSRGNDGHGIHVLGHNNVIGGDEPWQRNVVSGNRGAGIALHYDSCTGNRVIGNYVGTDIDGTAALGNEYYGIGVEQGPAGNLIVANVCSGNVGEGINIVDPGSSYNSVVGNIVGLDATGTAALGNTFDGILLGVESDRLNRVGGTSPEERNIISGNHGAGINIGGVDQIVLGNYIGTDITGSYAIGNNDGVSIGGGEHNFVGGSSNSERNVISGNAGWGVRVWGASANWVMGNYIGVDPGGTLSVSNGEAVHLDTNSRHTVFQRNVISGNGSAVVIRDGSEYTLFRANRVGVAARDDSPVPNERQGVLIESAANQIGGPYPGDGNIIAHNPWDGVQVRTHPGNSILGNSIYGNDGWGIKLEDGGNNSLAAPEITDADAKSIQGMTCAGCRVDIFSDEDNQGRVYEGNTLADGTGSFEFDSATRLRGPFVTCTTTDPEGNTSPFSEPVAPEFVRRGGRRVPP